MNEYLLEFAKQLKIQFIRGFVKDPTTLDDAYLNKVRCERSFFFDSFIFSRWFEKCRICFVESSTYWPLAISIHLLVSVWCRFVPCMRNHSVWLELRQTDFLSLLISWTSTGPIFLFASLLGSFFPVICPISGAFIAVPSSRKWRPLPAVSCSQSHGVCYTRKIAYQCSKFAGFLCPVHTPDGAPCGLLNHMTRACQVDFLQLSNSP